MSTTVETLQYSKSTMWMTPVSRGIWEVKGMVMGDHFLLEESTRTLKTFEGERFPLKDRPDVEKFYKKFKSLPEYMVCKFYEMEYQPLTPSELREVYLTLLEGVMRIKAYKDGANPDESERSFKRCRDWLDRKGFFHEPASSIYHDNYDGGLLVHSLKVAYNAANLWLSSNFSTEPIESVILVALAHDWCKIGSYEKYQKNVKNETTGRWEKEDAYRRKDSMIPLGHGVASMYIASKFFKLTIEEALAIRWHMAKWNVCQSENNEYQQANEHYPLVLLLQFADQLSITEY